MSILKVNDLTKCYPGVLPTIAVDHISFELKQGEILGFLGPNGSGKTTTIQMLLGTLLKTSGTIHYFDLDFSIHSQKILQRVSFASTYLSLPHVLTVAENLEVLGLLYGISRQESRKRYEPLLERFGISKYRDKKVAVLSAGQVTRLMMVKAFFIQPKVVLLDEPTASLDPDISRDVCSFLLEQRDKCGLSILFTSHKMTEVAEVCDRVIFLDQGKIIADDLPQNLAKKSAFFSVHLTVGDDLQRAIDLAIQSKYPYRCDAKSIEVDMDENQIPIYLHTLSHLGVTYSTIRVEEPSLDDYFLKIARNSRIIPCLENKLTYKRVNKSKIADHKKSCIRLILSNLRTSISRQFLRSLNGNLFSGLVMSRIKGIFFRYFYVLLKGPQQLSDLFYWPLIDILLWGLTSIWIASTDQDSQLPLILMTGLIFWQITWRGSIDISVSLLQEFWHRNLINLFATPLRIAEWGLGVILLCLTKLCITVFFGLLTVYLLYGLKIYMIGWMFLPMAAMLITFGWTLGFLAASLIVRWGHQVESIAWMIGYLFAPFSAVFYPVSVLPEWAQAISWCLPTTYIFEGMRVILHDGTFPIAYFWKSLGLNIAYISAVLSLFSYFFKKSREKGLARLE